MSKPDEVTCAITQADIINKPDEITWMVMSLQTGRGHVRPTPGPSYLEYPKPYTTGMRGWWELDRSSKPSCAVCAVPFNTYKGHKRHRHHGSLERKQSNDLLANGRGVPSQPCDVGMGEDGQRHFCRHLRLAISLNYMHSDVAKILYDIAM
jgi:hypothetical protein